MDHETVQTKVDAEMAQAEQLHENDPHRANLLRLARRFKASWLELGEALSEIKRTGSWRNWGFASFEDYTKKELHLRNETVDKLTGSFSFLKARAPQVLERDALSESVPSYQAVDFLRKAEARAEAVEHPEAITALYTQIVDEGAPLTKVRRAFEPVLFTRTPDEQRKKDEAAMRSLASRLLELLRHSSALEGGTRNELSQALELALKTLAERAPQDGEHAA